MGEWAANLILANVFATIDVKENVDSSTEGPEPEPPVDSEEQKGAERSPTRPIPKPLQAPSIELLSSFRTSEMEL